MSAVNDGVVRDYFETLGFLTIQPRKYAVPGRQKRPDEEVDLIVQNPRLATQTIPAHMVWTGADLARIARAVVAVRGWHTERFSVSRLDQTPDILGFVEAESMRFAVRTMGTRDMAWILCLPRLPASGVLKQQTIETLRARGVHGILSFETILRELIARVEINRNYERSDLLQMIRLLKNYDLLKDVQLELFDGEGRPRRRKAADPAHPTAPPDAELPLPPSDADT